MEKKKGWRPSTRKYDPNDPHFNPMHPPKDTPKEVLERMWGETFDDEPRDSKKTEREG